MPVVPPRRATAADLAALPEDVSAEIVAGALVPLPLPSFQHGDVLANLTEQLAPFCSRRSGLPGGWWMSSAVDVELELHEVYCPDLAGWRWDRVPERPRGSPVRVRPDWLAEVISPATARRDRVEKLRALHRCGVPHYWILDPADRALYAYTWHLQGYLLSTVAADAERVRVQPFDGVVLALGEVFGGGAREPDSLTSPG